MVPDSSRQPARVPPQQDDPTVAAGGLRQGQEGGEGDRDPRQELTSRCSGESPGVHHQTRGGDILPARVVARHPQHRHLSLHLNLSESLDDNHHHV